MGAGKRREPGACCCLRLAADGSGHDLLRARVAAALRAEADRSGARRAADAPPPLFPLRFPPFLLDVWVSAFPRPPPDLFPPPDSLFTVAHARRSASFLLVPRFS